MCRAPDTVVAQTAHSDGHSARLARAQVSTGQEDGVHGSVATQAARVTLTQTPVGLLQPLKLGHLVPVVGGSGCAARRRLVAGHGCTWHC